MATSFGSPVRDAGLVDPQEVNGLGFLLIDKKARPFKLEVESIKVVRANRDNGDFSVEEIRLPLYE